MSRERVGFSASRELNKSLRVRVLSPTKIFLSADALSIRVNVRDGVMWIGRRYFSTIEKLREGEIKLKLLPDINSSASEKRYHISEGWLIVSFNMCELLVKTFREVS